MRKICHLSSVHRRSDTRIALKELTSLARAGFDCTLIVADGLGDEHCNDYQVLDVGKPRKGRLQRMFATTGKVFKKALDVDAQLYHFHDPELISVGLKLKRAGKRVIYDIHEDVPRDIMSKTYIAAPLRKLISLIFEQYENYCVRHFDYNLTATPFIRKRFEAFTDRVTDINNYPLLNEVEKLYSDWFARQRELCHIGNLTRVRGIVENVQAMSHVEATLNLAGDFDDDNLRLSLMALQEWQYVKYWGFVNRSQFVEILKRSKIGLVTFHPEPNHIDAQPNKLFEFMSAGIPVITSNFPLWLEIVEGNDCGICINPLDPKAISDAINRLFANDELAREMGERGRKAVLERYNWSHEEAKLLEIYNRLLSV